MPSPIITNFEPIATPFSTPVVTAPLSIDRDESGNFVASIDSIANAITHGVQTYYGTQAQIEQAKANAAISKAQGQNAVQVAQVGLPSPQLLLAAGVGIVALMLLTGKRGR